MTNKKKMGLILLAYGLYIVFLGLYLSPMVQISIVVYGLMCVLLLIGLILLLSFHIGSMMSEEAVHIIDIVMIFLSVLLILWLGYSIVEIYILMLAI